MICSKTCAVNLPATRNWGSKSARKGAAWHEFLSKLDKKIKTLQHRMKSIEQGCLFLNSVICGLVIVGYRRRRENILATTMQLLRSSFSMRGSDTPEKQQCAHSSQLHFRVMIVKTSSIKWDGAKNLLFIFLPRRRKINDEQHYMTLFSTFTAEISSPAFFLELVLS